MQGGRELRLRNRAWVFALLWGAYGCTSPERTYADLADGGVDASTSDGPRAFDSGSDIDSAEPDGGISDALPGDALDGWMDVSDGATDASDVRAADVASDASTDASEGAADAGDARSTDVQLDGRDESDQASPDGHLDGSVAPEAGCSNGGCAAIGAHHDFTCANVGGVAKCWGTNGYSIRGTVYDGFLGIGQSYVQTSYSAVPLAVTDLGAGVQAVSTGSESQHACAVVNGAVKCWGWNYYGQLGDGTTSNSNAPVQVAGITSDVLDVVTGPEYSCALVNGAVQCWGHSTNGVLGVSGDQTIMNPTTIALIGTAQAITAGGDHACALVSGSVWCWGDNSSGRLGNNSTTPSDLPVQVVGLGSNVQAISAGESHTCAISNGGLLCWGNNSNGQLGDGTTTERWVPIPVQGLSTGVQAVSAGTGYTCAVVNGGAWCWGSNATGQLGDNSTTDRPSPVAVQGLGSGVRAITAGSNHSCALVGSGVECWGYNPDGELGNNSTSDSPIPVAVQGL